MMVIMTVPEVTEQLITSLSTFKFKSNVLKQLDINKGTPPNNLPLLSTYTVVNGVYVDFSYYLPPFFSCTLESIFFLIRLKK